MGRKTTSVQVRVYWRGKKEVIECVENLRKVLLAKNVNGTSMYTDIVKSDVYR